MPTKTWSISKDTLLAKVGSTSLGGGADPHLPVGYWSGYHFRAALKFNVSWSDVVQITKAELHLKTTGQVHVGFGSDPDIYVRRITGGNFSENSAKGSSDGGSGWSTSGSTYDDVSSTSTGEATKDITTAENTWVTIDITSIVEAWAPTSVKKSDGSAGDGQPNYGIHLLPVTDGASSETTEFYSQESSHDPYITLTYTSNTAPNAPTLKSPVGGTVVSGIDILTFEYVYSDPQGDPSSTVQVQVATDSGFTNIVVDDTAGIVVQSGGTVSQTAGWVPTRGVTYYWRARTQDNGGLWGPYSSTGTFKANSLPVATPSSPHASGLAAIWNLGDLAVWDAAGSFAKPTLSWSYSDAEGQAQAGYQVQIGTDASTAGVYDSGQIGSSAKSLNVPAGLVLGTLYYWRVRVKDSFGEWGNWSAWTSFKVRWGQAIYEYAPVGGADSSSWNFSSSQPKANTQQAFAFATATGANGAGRSSWHSDIGALTPAAYLNVLVRLATTVSGTQPQLDSMEFTYLASAVQPDKWLLVPTSDWVLDPSVRRYGSQSLRCRVSDGSSERVAIAFTKDPNDDIACLQGTTYTLSAWVKTNGPLATGASIQLRVYPSGQSIPIADGGVVEGDGATVDTSAYTEGWKRLHVTFTTPIGVNRISVQVHYTPNGTTAGDTFWVDGVKMEEGTVATAWTPGFVGDPTVLDSGGISIDGSAGGVFRLRGNTGGARDTVQLGDHGLIFGGDVEIYSDAVGKISLPRIRLTATDDVSLSSTTVPFQIGADDGLNLAIDNNEIEARNNGAASVLNLNIDGGQVVVGGGGLKINGGGINLVGALTGGTASQQALQSAGVVLTTALQDIPGCSLTLNAGLWEIVGIFDFHVSPAGSAEGHGFLDVGGSPVSTPIAFYQSVDGRSRATIAQVWRVSIASNGTVVKLRGIVTSTSGTISCDAYSSITARPLAA